MKILYCVKTDFASAKIEKSSKCGISCRKRFFLVFDMEWMSEMYKKEKENIFLWSLYENR
ncbi:hypothetical protein ATZ36_16235 [Candidatus Endomicrobiellum trichonymphae]|uniref:Uncharacterized protein n=1 Tax=Endomicrobium trichonymphae TaxID=1408204 RepID=A0A1E5IL03_ENDTX|nr:hypothetical protein ATZ36_16235 [Candidatus Endomicrobium trichonymphae]